jgi:2-polyprenyl-6-methoxyphenol hydroxylase-like FAD-dependent oxidoreductase
MVESTIARSAERERGVEIRRGTGVRGLVVEPARDGRPSHVSGVVTERGETLRADLVIDAGGRRSMLGDWLAAAGAPAPVEERADSGYVYYGRHYRSSDGAMPPMLGSVLQHYESVSLLTLPADNGYWSVVVTTSAKDTALRRARDVEVWERIVRSYPLVAHWTDAEPVTGIDVMAKIEDRVRRFDPATAPTGLIAVGDAAACTNPSVGRGASLAFLHAVCLRDVLRDVGTRAPDELALRWSAASAERVDPFVSDTLNFDRHRRAQIEAEIAGVAYETPDPSWNLGRALIDAAPHDPSVLRGALSVAGLLARGVDVISQPGMMDAIMRVGPVPPLPGPNRSELLGLIDASSREVA